MFVELIQSIALVALCISVNRQQKALEALNRGHTALLSGIDGLRKWLKAVSIWVGIGTNSEPGEYGLEEAEE